MAEREPRTLDPDWDKDKNERAAITQEIKDAASREIAALANAHADIIRTGEKLAKKYHVPANDSLLAWEQMPDGSRGPRKYPMSQEDEDLLSATLKNAEDKSKALGRIAEPILNRHRGMSDRENEPMGRRDGRITGQRIVFDVSQEASLMAQALVKAEKALQAGGVDTAVPPAALPGEPQKERQR